ncbi:MAG: endonuclease/exonuclease/phosphatase family protein [Clostridia bacterium]|nr:endonuclease/exonuclease/phosphatase family protein [Clostridia bacterium]
MNNGNGFGSAPIRNYKKPNQPNWLRTTLVLVMTAILIVFVVIFIMSVTGTGLFADRKGGGKPDIDPPVSSTDGNGSTTGGGDATGGDTTGGDTTGGDTTGGDTTGGDTTGGDNSGSSGADGDEYAALVADTSGTAIRFMSQNIRTGSSLTGTGDGENNQIGYRRYRFKALVEKYDPDVICTQEVTPLWIEQFNNLLGSTYSMEYKMRSDKSKEATPVHWKTSKYDMVSVEHFWLSSTPNVESSCYGETGIPGRITTSVTLKDKATGSKFTVLSTHFGLGGGAVVIGSGNQIADMFAKMPKGTYAFVLGDFNDKYQSTEYFTYCDMERLVDLRDICSDMADVGIGKMGDLRNGSFNGFNVAAADGGSYIDHVMAKPNAKMAVEYYSVLYDQLGDDANGAPVGYISDHFAVICDVRIDTTPSYKAFYGDNVV